MAGNVWDADVAVTPELARALIEGQFPQLAPARVEEIGVGWDNVAYRVNGSYVFRFPRRRLGGTLLANETRSLPHLAPHLSLLIPAPAFVGSPEGDYPYPFAGYPFLPGVTADRYFWTDEARTANAAVLGRFLAALHSVPVDATTRAWAPGDEIERADLAKRMPMTHERAGALAPSLPAVDLAAVLAEMERIVAAAPYATDPPCWVHGDLYPRHLLVDEVGAVCGVIDWGDVHLGDRALDLSVAFTFLPPAAWDAFRAAYGLPIEPATWNRARWKALFYGVALAHYGILEGDSLIRDLGTYALKNALP